MSLELVKYRESLSSEELSFLRQKEEKERRQFYRLIRVFMVMSFICPFIVAWFRAAKGAENPFSVFHYFIGVGFLLCFSGSCIYIAYSANLRKLQHDLRDKTKTVERTFITRKQYMPVNNTYFFYLSSPNKLSIEVNEFDYRRLDKGDELSIEYTSASKFYLGYF